MPTDRQGDRAIKHFITEAAREIVRKAILF